MTAQLNDQLGALLKGRGLNRGTLAGHVGAELRHALGLPATMTQAQLRASLREVLESAAQPLAPDLAEVFLAAAGITSQARLLEERLEEVGAHRGRGLRTMRRRLDEAKRQVVEGLADRRTPTDDPVTMRGWTFDRFALTIDLSATPARFVTERTIVATRDGLSEIVEVFTLPTADVDVSLLIEALSGCAFVGLDHLGPSSWGLRFRLPHALAAGQTHDCTVSVTLPEPRAMRPAIYLAPLRPCQTFTATLVQGDQRRVRDVVRLDGVDPTNPEVGRVPIDTSRGAHLISHTFTAPQVGFRYGLEWEWAD